MTTDSDLSTIFGDALRDLEKYKTSLRTKERFNGTLAYAQKAVVIFAGLAIASGLIQQTVNQILGIGITVAVAFDALLSVNNRLIAYATGSRALESIAEFMKGLERVHMLDNDQESLKWYRRAINEITTKVKEVREAVNKADIAALSALAVQPQQQTQKTQSDS